MRKDIDIPKAENVGIAVAEERIGPDGPEYGVYIINMNDFTLENVLVSSSGVGEANGQQVKTTQLRHFLNDVAPRTSSKIETIMPEVFCLNNGYFLTYYVGLTLFEKKYTFLEGTIQKTNYVNVPGLNLPGVLIV